MKHLTWLLILIIAQQAFGQEAKTRADSATKLDTTLAKNLLIGYQAASRLKMMQNGTIDPAWESMFKDCFATESVIFDIPNKYPDGKNPNFQKHVSLNRYIELVREIYYQHPDLDEIEYDFVILGKDFSQANSGNRIIFEVEKIFTDTSWAVAGSGRYLFDVQLVQGEPKITRVRLSLTDVSRNKVDLTFVQPPARKKSQDDFSRMLFTRLKIDHDENVYDRNISGWTDSAGRITLGEVSARARIIVEKVHGPNKEQFTLPSDWETEGRLVAQQPAGGYKINARPYKWSGWTLTGKIGGGLVTQSPVNTANFTPGTDFKTNPGYQFGGGVTLTRFFEQQKWRNQNKNLIFGVGTGISFQYVRYNVSAIQFDQNPEVSLIDPAGDTCDILIMGSNYEEALGTALIKIPLYGEARKKLRNKFLGFNSFSLQAGVNFMIPFLSRFSYEGIFSRHGRYPGPVFNNQVITDDPFYNYYTDLDREDDGVVDYDAYMFEGMIRLNGFIPIDQTNNSIVIALEFTTPFSGSTTGKTSDVLISSGEEGEFKDEFTSTAFAKEKLYEYYFGISIGLNFIKYRPD